MQTHFCVVAIGDLHIQHTHPRNAARLAAWDWIVHENIGRPNLAAWLQVGDLYHGRSTAEDRNHVSARLQRMANVAPVIIIRGNHEQPGDLQILAELKAACPIWVFEAPVARRIPTAFGDLTLGAIPYPHKSGLIAAGIDASATLQAGDGALTDILQMLAPALNEATYPLFAAHLNLAGSIASNGQPQIGRELELAPQTLDLLSPRVPKVLGHIHKPQTVNGAHYVGSVCRLDFGETELKRYLVVEYHPFPVVVFCPVPVAPMYRVTGDLTRDGFAWQADDDYRGPWDGCEVKAFYRFLASERNVLNHDLVRAPFEGALRLEVEPIAIPDRALRAPEVAEARTLADKVRAWARLADEDVTDSLLDKLAWLEGSEPTATLSAVATQIAGLESPEKRQVAA